MFLLVTLLLVAVQGNNYSVWDDTLDNFVHVNNDFIFSYKVQGENIVLQVQTTYIGWIGLTFGKWQGDTYFLFSEVTNDSHTFDILDSYTNNFYGQLAPLPIPDTEQGGQNDILDSKFSIQEVPNPNIWSKIKFINWKTYTWTRKLNTSDHLDFVFQNDSTVDVMFMWNLNTKEVKLYHKFWIITFQLLSVFKGDVFKQNISKATVPIYTYHTWILFACWGLLAPLLILLVRHFKHKISVWFWIHQIGFWIIAVLTLAESLELMFATQVFLTGTVGNYEIFHKLIGITTFGFLIISITAGYIARYGNQNSEGRGSVVEAALIHKMAGYSALCLSFVQFTTGSIMWQEESSIYTHVSYGLIGAIIVSCLLLELIKNSSGIMFLTRALNKKQGHEVVTQQTNSRLNKMTMNEFLDSKRFLVLLDDLVLDITEYMQGSHPGGRQVLEKCNKREIGGYLNGSEAEIEEGGFERWQHSVKAYEIAAQLAVAKLDVQSSLLQAHGQAEKENNMEQGLLIQDFTKNYVWNTIGRADLGESVFKLTLQCPNLSMVNEFEKSEADWLFDVGKHFKILFDYEELHKEIGDNERFTSTFTGTDRYYTVVRALTPQNCMLAGEILGVHWKDLYCTNQKWLNETYAKQIKGENKNPYEFLDFYIKAYRNDGLVSNYLDKVQVNKSLRIIGPIGCGLQFTDHFLRQKPKIVVFCAGTGIDEYTDLVFYILGQNYKQLTYNIKLTLFAACPSEEECIGLKLMQETARKYPRDFKLALYFSASKTQLERANNKRFTSDFVTKFEPEIANFDRIYITGPERFERGISKVCEKLGIQDKVRFT